MRKLMSFIAISLSILGIAKSASAYDLLNKIHLPSSDAELEIMLNKAGVSFEDIQTIEDKKLEEMTNEELKKIIIMKDLSQKEDTDSCRCA